MKIVKTDSKNPDFVKLVKQLDTYLAVTDGDEHDFYNQFNSIQNLKYVIVVYNDNEPIGCGAIKPFDDSTMEIKRMYVSPSERGKGFASKIIDALEAWAKELKYSYTILETGNRQFEAVAFYKKSNYTIIENYGQYKGVKNSVCFKKQLQ